jgi:hypothetical protein
MSDYVKNTNFAVKDGYTTGDPRKTVKGTEIDDEFNSIASAISSKADTASPTFTGTPAAPTASDGTNTTQIATTAFVIGERTSTSTLTNKTLTAPVLTAPVLGTPNSGTLTNCTDLPIVNGTTGTLSVARGGTGLSTLTANNVLLGNGTSAPTFVAPGSNGNVLVSNGTAWTSAAPAVSTPTTAQVLSASAGITANAVGSYAWIVQQSGGNVDFGGTLSGSTLQPTGIIYNVGLTGGPYLSGSWRCMGGSPNGAYGAPVASLWLRIS